MGVGEVVDAADGVRHQSLQQVELRQVEELSRQCTEHQGVEEVGEAALEESPRRLFPHHCLRQATACDGWIPRSACGAQIK